MGIFLETAKDTNYNKVLRSALTLFVTKGFFNTSMPDLVKHSGVSNGSIYYQFKDKQQVAEALLDALVLYIEGEQRIILEQNQSCWAQYYQLTKWLFIAARDQPHLMQFVLKAQHQEFLPEKPPICSAQPFLNLRDVIAKGMQKQEIRQMDIMVAASIAFGGPLRLIQLSLDGILTMPITEYLDEITQSAWLSLENNSQQNNLKTVKIS